MIHYLSIFVYCLECLLCCWWISVKFTDLNYYSMKRSRTPKTKFYQILRIGFIVFLAYSFIGTLTYFQIDQLSFKLFALSSLVLEVVAIYGLVRGKRWGFLITGVYGLFDAIIGSTLSSGFSGVIVILIDFALALLALREYRNYWLKCECNP